VLNGNSVFDLSNFDLHYFFQECIPGIKQDLHVVFLSMKLGH